MRRVSIIAITTGFLAVTMSSAGALGVSSSPREASETAAKVTPPDGYRNANRKERKQMNRAANKANYNVKKRYGWFIGKRDDSFGFVCGKNRGSPKSVGLRNRRGKWKLWRNITSGDFQTYDLMCVELARRAVS